jgi:uncharacterized membrane protein YcaP (DUF421 family)
LLIYKGSVNKAHLRKVGISSDELLAVVREHGLSDFNQVDLCMLEVNGNISVLSHNYTERTVKHRSKSKIDR